MIEVKDEILDGEPLYRITDKNGNILFDDVKIEMTTKVLQTGTPQAKYLFDSIKSGNDLVQKYNEIQPIMRDGYNYINLENSITKYEKGQRVLIDTTIQPTKFNTSIIPIFGASDTVVEGFSLTHSNFFTNPQNMFDGNPDTYAQKGSGGSSFTATLAFPYKIKPTKIRAKSGTNNALQIFTSTTTLVNSIGTNAEEIYEITDTDFIESISIGGQSINTSLNIYSVEIIEGEAYMFNPALYTYININNLGNVLIDKFLEQNKKYELVYDGTMFIATEV